MIKYTNGWDIAKKIKPECFQENLPKSNYPMYGWLHETFNSSETKKNIIHVVTTDLQKPLLI